MAAAAPGKATIESVWPAKVCWRTTMNQPTMAAVTATIVPASRALTMNGNAVNSRRSDAGFQERPAAMRLVGMALGVDRRWFRLADDDQTAIGGPKDLDCDAVKTAEGLARDDLSRGALECRTGGEVDDAVEVAEDGVDVVRDQQYGHPFLAADPLDERGDAA